MTRSITTAAGVFAPGHLGELTQVIDAELVDSVLVETGAREQRVRLLPARVVVYFVLALGLFEGCSYRGVWDKLTAGLGGLGLRVPVTSSLARARRRVGAAPFRALFEVLAGPVGGRGRAGVWYRGLRVVAVDGTQLRVPDVEGVTWRYRKRAGERVEFGYPLLRLLVVIECGTRAVLGAAFGPESSGELAYARRLLGVLGTGMLLLADAGFDAAAFLAEVAGTEARFLVRGGAARNPTILRRLADGSYLARIGYGVLPELITVRIIEAEITVTTGDGTRGTERWRLITSLLDEARYPATDLVGLYHQRWQIETAYYSIKKTMLDGRVLRSRGVEGLDQEVWALLAVYQGLIRAAGDAVAANPEVNTHQVSFTVLLRAAGDLLTNATGIHPPATIDLTGEIGRRILAQLLPAEPRHRTKKRTRKNPTSNYSPSTARPSPGPDRAKTYTLEATIMIFENGLTARRNA
jgi:hypothetical protein